MQVSFPGSLIDISQGARFTLSGSDDISLLTMGWAAIGAATRDTLVRFTVTTPEYFADFSITDGLVPGLLLIVATATMRRNLAPLSTLLHLPAVSTT